MGIFKSLPEPIKKYLKRKLRVPRNSYQNVHTEIKITNYHKDRFNEYHNKFCKSDAHLNFDNNVTRFRNYNVYKFGELAIKSNPSGCFLSAGISYGTSLKVLTHLLDPLASGNKYYLIDPYKNIGNLNYNTDIENVKKDLTDIKNFEFIFYKELLTNQILDNVDNNLTFSHLNTFHAVVAEFNSLEILVKKTLTNGIIIIDNYGFLSHKEQERIDEFIKKNKPIHSYVSPSLQMILTIK